MCPSWGKEGLKLLKAEGSSIMSGKSLIVWEIFDLYCQFSSEKKSLSWPQLIGEEFAVLRTEGFIAVGSGARLVFDKELLINFI